jgi:hypothetical protein
VLKVFNGRPKNGYLDAYTRVLLLRDIERHVLLKGLVLALNRGQ